MFVIFATIGLIPLGGIVSFEKYGGDPQKRSFGNRMTSFLCSQLPR